MRAITQQLVFTLLLSLLLGGAPAHAASPVRSLKQTHRRINRLLKQNPKPGSARDKQVKQNITAAVNAFLDFEELAKRSLGRHWESRTDAEREEFVQILQELIERNYVKQLRSNLGYRLEYKGEEVDGDNAKVTTVVSVKKNRRTTEMVIEYKMLKTQRGWMVYDVITDDVSLVRNYRSQFNRIIRRKSYKALVDKMRRKLDELQKKSS